MRMKAGLRRPTRRDAIAALSLGVPAVLTTWRSARAQAKLRNITFVQPNPSAINSFQLHVAIGEGYFKDEGLNIRVETVDGSAPVLQALAAGQAQFGRPGPAPVLQARARGVDVVFLYNAVPTSAFGVVVKRDAADKSPGDLKGKVIGTGTGEGGEVGCAVGIVRDRKMKEPG